MSDLKTNHITHGAVIAALYIVLLLIVLYVPLLNLIVIFFLPLPFSIHMVRFGVKPTLLMGVVSLCLTLLIAPVPVIFVTCVAVSVGMVMGHFYARRKGPFLPLLSGMVTYIVNYVLLFALSFFLLNINIMDYLEQLIRESMLMTEGTAGFLNMPMNEEFTTEEIIEGLTYAFPAIMILSALLMSTVNHGVSRPILQRLGHKVQALPPFREWNLPKSVLFYYLFTLIFIILGIMEEGGTLFFFVINLHMILEILLLIQGLTWSAHFAYVKKWGKLLPISAVILAFIPLFANLIRIIGILDLGFRLKERVQ